MWPGVPQTNSSSRSLTSCSSVIAEVPRPPPPAGRPAGAAATAPSRAAGTAAAVARAAHAASSPTVGRRSARDAASRPARPGSRRTTACAQVLRVQHDDVRRRTRRAPRRACPTSSHLAPSPRPSRPARPRATCERPAAAAARRGPGRTRSRRRRARPARCRMGGDQVARVEVLGHVVRPRPADPAAPALSIRESRNTRVAPRSRSWPTTYQRPPRLITAHGSRCRSRQPRRSGLR